MRANMPRTSDRHVNEKPFRIALNLRESAPFYPLDLQKIANLLPCSLADALSHQKPCRQKSADFDRRSHSQQLRTVAVRGGPFSMANSHLKLVAPTEVIEQL